MKHLALALELYGEAEQSACKHCGLPIIRWPNRRPEYASPHDKYWIHNPSKGFRLRMCQGGMTTAEPKGVPA